MTQSPLATLPIHSSSNQTPPTMKLTQVQELQLANITSRAGRKCLLGHWLRLAEENRTGAKSYCDPYWDDFYCWPPTKAGEAVIRTCAEIMSQVPQAEPHHLNIPGNAYRVCTENATWLWGNWTNYTECVENLDDPAPTLSGQVSSGRGSVAVAVRNILFIGSILSFLCLVISLIIFSYFKSLRCDRITVHIHLMVAMALRFLLLIFISEPYVFGRKENYRAVDWACKLVLSFLMYATVASINWMFIQGHYLHGRLTTNIFDRGTPFKIYYTIGWALPVVLIVVWVFLMESYHHVHCWLGFAELKLVWVLVGPMILALLINLFFLINIMRILLTKARRTPSTNDTAQFRRAVKATVVLFPLLGMNNLVFVYNPGGALENAYMLTNTILLSTQGIFVALLYCFMSSDVRDAFRREYRRFLARRSANSFQTRSRKKSSFSTSVMMMTPRIGGLTRFTRPTNPQAIPNNFRTRIENPVNGENSTNVNVNPNKNQNQSQSPSPETAVNFLQQEDHQNGLNEIELHRNGFTRNTDKAQAQAQTQDLPNETKNMSGALAHEFETKRISK